MSPIKATRCCGTCGFFCPSECHVEPSRQLHPDNPVQACTCPAFTFPDDHYVRASWSCDQWVEDPR